jgi:hypothetical protein
MNWTKPYCRWLLWRAFRFAKRIRSCVPGRLSGNQLSPIRASHGQATVETALIMMTVMLPLTFGVVALADVAWTYHALVTLTRQGARYAATHCYEDDNGSNVVTWMQLNSPPFLDRPQLVAGTVQISVNYWSHDLANQVSSPFSSCGSTCTPECVPDAVTVSISGYQLRHLLPLLGPSLQDGIAVPAFSTTVEIQSAGGDPETLIAAP